MEDEDDDVRITNGVPKNTPMKVLVRVYVVKVPFLYNLTIHLLCVPSCITTLIHMI